MVIAKITGTYKDQAYEMISNEPVIPGRRSGHRLEVLEISDTRFSQVWITA